MSKFNIISVLLTVGLCSAIPQNSNNSIPNNSFYQECGHDYPIDPKIHEEIPMYSIYKFPWTVAVFAENILHNIMTVQRPTHRCDGSVIHPQVILTTASCINPIRPPSYLLSVRPGYNTGNFDSTLVHEQNVSNVRIHPGFNRKTGINNFAVLILAEPLKLSQYVNTVCLPNKDETFNNFECNGSERWVRRTVLTTQKCEKALKFNLNYKKFYNSLLCASCQDDFDPFLYGRKAGSLVCPMKNDSSRFVLAGLNIEHSWCEQNGMPGTFASVSHARDWIDGILSNYGYNL